MKLVLIDTAGIQRYIFGSNRLRENVGASYLVALATREWVFETLPAPNNMRLSAGQRWEFLANQQIEADSQLRAEVIYAGGGNAVILFQQDSDAKAFEREFTKKVLSQAPGLQAVVAIVDFDWNQKPRGLQQAVSAGLQELNMLKRMAPPSQPLLGLGVTRACQSTGLPAVTSENLAGREENLIDVCSEVLAKHRCRSQANQRLTSLIPAATGFAYPDQLDDLGRSIGEFSYIAIVHIDGNGLGRRITGIGAGEDNRQYIHDIRAFSDALNEAGIESLKSTVNFLTGCIDSRDGALFDRQFAEKSGSEILLNSGDDNSWLLPIRPIIYGGDDVTFVCDARIAIPLTLKYIESFQEQTAGLPGGGGSAGCCGGISIVKSHYPFARAYQLSEQLCGSAKKLVRNGNLNDSALDWHFANAGLAGDLDEIRQRELEVAEGLLHLRPVLVSDQPSDPRTWSVVQRGIDGFRTKDWAGRRNKIKGLRDVLRSGSEATRQFCKKYSLKLPDLGLDGNQYQTAGWISNGPQIQNRCAYFDMIELVDFVIPLRLLSDEQGLAAEEGVVT